ncbi:hypothetical protein SAY87_022202 [Trapa incisa]|uniref:Interactor of constitutive active ROPs 4-like n=1 Tax=Trapa incisa TaxID=236973 RepID=A0AAN7JUY1_9MYRT|nr:hypothetical protein SAY87_022202 [Trapa incisa]
MSRVSATRGSEMKQRQSPRGPHQLRTAGSDSDSSHHRTIPDRSPRVGDRRSPRSVQSKPVQKKLGTRISDLESQLGQAQEELKSLKKQLETAEAAKKEAQAELEKKGRKKRNDSPAPQGTPRLGSCKIRARSSPSEDIPDEIEQETDVFEVPMEEEKVRIELKTGKEDIGVAESDREERDSKRLEPKEQEKQLAANEPEPAAKEDEISVLKSKLEEKERELGEANQETESLKKHIIELNEAMSSAQARETEMAQRLKQMEEELGESHTSNENLNEKLRALEEAKESLEAEMKRLQVQTEQWRKAADAAAAVLADEPETNHGRIPGRCASMDKHFAPIFEIPSGYTGFVGLHGNADDGEDGFGGGRRKGSGIRMFGDLWKKKNHK